MASIHELIPKVMAEIGAIGKERLGKLCIPVPESGCWIWLGSTDRKGYGRICINYKDYAAHRLSYQIYKGDIPSEMSVLHDCDTPSCVNPSHLHLGTQRDNLREMTERKRRSIGCKNQQGVKNGRSKLTDELILEIRSDERRQIDIAKDYGITQASVSSIKRLETWKHIGGNICL